MKKFILTLLCLTLCLSVFTACSDKKNEETAKDFLNNTEFNVSKNFKGMTFGEVMEKFVSTHPDTYKVTYNLNEEIKDFDKLGQLVDNFDTTANDYISCHIRWEFTNEEDAFEYEEVLFSVNKNTKEVTPIAVSIKNEDWKKGTAEDIISQLYLTLYVFTGA